MAGTRVFVHENIYDKFVSRAVEMAKAKKIGAPFEEGVENGPLISQLQMDKVLNYIDLGQKEGAKLLCGGKRIKRDGYFVETTVFADVTDDMTIAKEEIFGPVMSILKFKTIDEVIKRANDSKYGLVSGVVTQSLDSAIKVSNKMQTGQVYVNCWAALQPSTPFGGFKESGLGRELGQKSLEGYQETKCVIIKTNE
jgi:aldehyde dehydrogenase (NAD+)